MSALPHPALPAAPSPFAALSAPLHLLGVGGLLAVSVLISKLAASGGAQMLWFLAFVLTGAGATLTALAIASGQLADARRLGAYATGAGLFAAVPSAMGYLSVAHVGAAYISLTFAFPVLLTFLIAVPLGMDRATPLRLLAVAAGLAGGLTLALGKASGTQADAGWTLLASAIPLILAMGNIYRTRFWPAGAAPLPLAALTMLAGGLAAMPAALTVEGLPSPDARTLHLAATGAAVLGLQYLFQFRLQRLAGPVYMSQIGSVAATLGAALAVLVMGEALPRGFWPAAILIAGGAAAFHLARVREKGRG